MQVAQKNAVVSARVPADLDRQARILATLRGCYRQDVVAAGLARELAEAPERPMIERLLGHMAAGKEAEA